MFKVHKFPYNLHFQVEQKKKIITLVAIFGTKQDPEKWETHP
jgi:hypothetical protein